MHLLKEAAAAQAAAGGAADVATRDTVNPRFLNAHIGIDVDRWYIYYNI